MNNAKPEIKNTRSSISKAEARRIKESQISEARKKKSNSLIV
jgi:hypothetical protein